MHHFPSAPLLPCSKTALGARRSLLSRCSISPIPRLSGSPVLPCSSTPLHLCPRLPSLASKLASSPPICYKPGDQGRVSQEAELPLRSITTFPDPQPPTPGPCFQSVTLGWRRDQRARAEMRALSKIGADSLPRVGVFLLRRCVPCGGLSPAVDGVGATCRTWQRPGLRPGLRFRKRISVLFWTCLPFGKVSWI